MRPRVFRNDDAEYRVRAAPDALGRARSVSANQYADRSLITMLVDDLADLAERVRQLEAEEAERRGSLV